ncbi:hypothetical protein Syun_012105 [Stephania yunnanensis]|uniref:Uncharacterized protein n=1 Tax=Stephania yunnanensis TaxID=152371 RepID=A0AAP0PIQ1_9MAGN
MANIFKRWMIPEGYCWKSVPNHHKDHYWRQWQELTRAKLDRLVDDEAVYYNVTGEYPRGRVYDLGSLGRKKRRYTYPGASTSQLPDMVLRSELDTIAEQIRQVVAFMQRQFEMTMDGVDISQPQPPPPPPPLPPRE